MPDNTMGKYVIGGIAVLFLLFVGYYYLVRGGTPVLEPVPQQQTGMATSTYATSTYSIVYPSDFSLNDAYAYDQFGPKKLIHGVKFTIPGTMATGTNLSADSGVSVEQLPRAQNCTGDIYLQADVKAMSVTQNGVQYSLATSSGAAAGNMYEEFVYALSGSKPCTAVRYLIHSTNIGNYEPGAVQEFDRAALIAKFDAIRDSLTFAGQAKPTRLETGLNQTGSALGVTITPLEVLEDSRCATDVTCIQAGTVRLRVSMQSGLGKADQVFKLGTLVTTEAEEITLVDVMPAPVSTVKIKDSDYRFVFEIKKRVM